MATLPRVHRVTYSAVNQNPWRCSVRALAAPFSSDLARLNAEFNLLTQALSPLAKNNEDLADALHFYGNPLERVRIFLWVTVELIRTRTLVLRALDASGKGISDTIIDQSVIHAYTDLPNTWYQVGGVWTNDALLDWELLTVYNALESDALDNYGLNIVAMVDLPKGTDSFLLGIREKGNRCRSRCLHPMWWPLWRAGVSPKWSAKASIQTPRCRTSRPLPARSMVILPSCLYSSQVRCMASRSTTQQNRQPTMAMAIRQTRPARPRHRRRSTSQPTARRRFP